MSASSLPPPPQVDLEGNALSAYNVSLAFERDSKTNDEAMYARVLGYLIIHAPSPTVRHNVEQAIHSCNHNYHALSKVGEAFTNYFIRPLKIHNACRTPDSSFDPSRRSVDKAQEYHLESFQESLRNHKEAKRQALVRDGFRCVVTRRYDNVALDMSDIDQGEICKAGSLYTECAHIVPESNYLNYPSLSGKNCVALVGPVLDCFGYNAENMSGSNVHSLSNMMTMDHNVLDLFDRLQLWFEPTEIENCYAITMVRSYYKVPERMTLSSPDPLRLPLPSPELLFLHAYCAKVAHFSGAGAYIDALEQEAEDLGVLAADGGSSSTLVHALLRSTVRLAPTCS